MFTARELDVDLAKAGAWSGGFTFKKGASFALPTIGHAATVVDSDTEEDFNSWNDETTTSAWVVFSVGKRLFRKEGYFNSWSSGSIWDGALIEVEAKQIVKTGYERI